MLSRLILFILLLSSCHIISPITMYKNNDTACHDSKSIFCNHDHWRVCKDLCNCSASECCVLWDFYYSDEDSIILDSKNIVFKKDFD